MWPRANTSCHRPRMSFFTPMNPILQRELGSVAYNRATIFPSGRISESLEFIEDPEARVQLLNIADYSWKKQIRLVLWLFSANFVSCINDESRKTLAGKHQEATEYRSPWANGRFRVLVGTLPLVPGRVVCGHANLVCWSIYGMLRELLRLVWFDWLLRNALCLLILRDLLGFLDILMRGPAVN